MKQSPSYTGKPLKEAQMPSEDFSVKGSVESSKEGLLNSSGMHSNGKLEAFFFVQTYLKFYGHNHRLISEVKLKEYWMERARNNTITPWKSMLFVLPIIAILLLLAPFNLFLLATAGIVAFAIFSYFQTERKNAEKMEKKSGKYVRNDWLKDFLKKRRENFLLSVGVTGGDWLRGENLIKQQDQIYYFMTWATNLKKAMPPLSVKLEEKEFTSFERSREIQEMYKKQNLFFGILEDNFERFKSQGWNSSNESELKKIFSDFYETFLDIIFEGIQEDGFLVNYIDDEHNSNKAKSKEDEKSTAFNRSRFEDLEKNSQEELLKKISKT